MFPFLPYLSDDNDFFFAGLVGLATIRTFIVAKKLQENFTPPILGRDTKGKGGASRTKR